MAGKRRSKPKREKRESTSITNNNGNIINNTSGSSDNIGENVHGKSEPSEAQGSIILDKIDNNNTSSTSSTTNISNTSDRSDMMGDSTSGVSEASSNEPQEQIQEEVLRKSTQEDAPLEIQEKIDNNNNTSEDEKANMSERMPKKTIFVTVGTTKFDKLINKILEREFIQALNELNYTNLIIQTGMSEYEYRKGELLKLVNSNQTLDDSDESTAMLMQNNNLKTEIYDYKQSITDDIEVADLVVGHAGAGTCLEVLRKKKKLLVVTNEDLMGNHQFELAQQLSDDKYLMACNISNLKESLIKISRPNVKFNVFPQQDVNKMARILDGILA